MLNEYKNKQELACNLFYNYIINNRSTHDYLIDENNYSDAYNFVISFVKAILCENNRVDNNSCNECSLCKRIDDGNYPELKIIVPDGAFIKKPVYSANATAVIQVDNKEIQEYNAFVYAQYLVNTMSGLPGSLS